MRAVVESGSGQQQERTSMSFADTAAELENDRAIPAVEENKCDVYICFNEASDAPGWSERTLRASACSLSIEPLQSATASASDTPEHTLSSST